MQSITVHPLPHEYKYTYLFRIHYPHRMMATLDTDTKLTPQERNAFERGFNRRLRRLGAKKRRSFAGGRHAN